MEHKRYCDPQEILEVTLAKGIAKGGNPIWKQLLLAVLAGAFIAFAAAGSNMAAYPYLLHPETYGLGKLLAGLVFPVGLMLVLLAGAELFTGNTLLSVAVCARRLSVWSLLRNWFFVYAGNLLGSLLIVGLILVSGQLHSGDNLLAGVTIRIASGKVSLGFLQAVSLGVMCNWLVCLGVWLCYGAKDMAGKILGIFFPIFLFITSGFEHSVANMYYIPAGILAKAEPAYAAASGLGESVLAELTWGSFFVDNLLPVTIGNIVGGAVFVGIAYWVAYRKRAA